MIIHDALYGRFELPAFLEPLLTTPEFRRLSEVRLININSPALSSLADVRRYSHTLGVLYLALQNPLINFGPDEVKAILASIIIHDAGTPAFAHLFEYQLAERFSWHHEAILPALAIRQHHVDAKLHQLYASRRPEFEKHCKASGIDFNIVLSILQQRHPASKLLFGSVDFDNLDNVARMSWMLGCKFDTAAILGLASSLGANDQAPLLLSEGQRENLKVWAALRRKAYEVIVFDGPTVAGQAVLSQLIRQGLEQGVLSAEDWIYTDNKLLEVLQSISPRSKGRLQRDFLGKLPQLVLLVQVTDKNHLLYKCSLPEISQHIVAYLKTRGQSRPYGYCLRDRGTFEKKVTAVDPDTGLSWSIGETSDSLLLYGFGGAPRGVRALEAGQDFLRWCETNHGN